MRVLGSIQELILERRTATQREIYYLHAQAFGHNASKAVDVLLDVCCMLGVSRDQVGILASCRGLLAGSVEVEVRRALYP